MNKLSSLEGHHSRNPLRVEAKLMFQGVNTNKGKFLDLASTCFGSAAVRKLQDGQQQQFFMNTKGPYNKY